MTHDSDLVWNAESCNHQGVSGQDGQKGFGQSVENTIFSLTLARLCEIPLCNLILLRTHPDGGYSFIHVNPCPCVRGLLFFLMSLKTQR